jgi:hypothetical protein
VARDDRDRAQDRVDLAGLFADRMVSGGDPATRLEARTRKRGRVKARCKATLPRWCSCRCHLRAAYGCRCRLRAHIWCHMTLGSACQRGGRQLLVAELGLVEGTRATASMSWGNAVGNLARAHICADRSHGWMVMLRADTSVTFVDWVQ